MAKTGRSGKDGLSRVPPQNIEAEQSLLGGLLIDPEAINKVVDIVGSNDFYRSAHGTVFSTIVDLYEKNEPVDIITISSALKNKGLVESVGGITYPTRSSTSCPVRPTSHSTPRWSGKRPWPGPL